MKTPNFTRKKIQFFWFFVKCRELWCFVCKHQTSNFTRKNSKISNFLWDFVIYGVLCANTKPQIWRAKLKKSFFFKFYNRFITRKLCFLQEKMRWKFGEITTFRWDSTHKLGQKWTGKSIDNWFFVLFSNYRLIRSKEKKKNWLIINKKSIR